MRKFQASRRELERAANSLNSAESWGTWDILGGGALSDMAKYSHIDEAVQYIEEANGKLGRFRRELADVDITIDVNVNISSFDRFADYFFDGLIADWNVQSKIKDSKHSVDTVINHVKTVISGLKSRYNSKRGSFERFRKTD